MAKTATFAPLAHRMFAQPPRAFLMAGVLVRWPSPAAHATTCVTAGCSPASRNRSSSLSRCRPPGVM